MTKCEATKWVASGRVRGWGNELPCDNKAVEGETLCRTHLKMERRNSCQCETCGEDVRERLQLGGAMLLTSKYVWAYCSEGHLTDFGRDNRIEMRARGLVS